MKYRLRWLLAPALVAALLPALAIGAAAARPDAPGLRPRPQPPTTVADENVGVFSTLCAYSHRASDDPIVHPGMPGMSHSHDFFGNVTTDAGSTYSTMRAGGTTCRAREDASGYWVPTLSQNGNAITPLSVKVYYRAGPLQAAAVQAPPAGLKIVAGDANATAPQGKQITFWGCRGMDMLMSDAPPTCPAGSTLDLHVRFPQCWDGVNLDSADHKSHLAYDRRGGCPADHPKALPKLAMIVHYPISGDPGTITLASGSVYSGHADFFNAWDQSFLTKKVQECINQLQRCGPA